MVSWITLLDSIPDLELVAYLPSFLGGLLRFLSDPNQDVHTITRVALDRFLMEIKKIAGIKRGIAESKRSHAESVRKFSGSSVGSPLPPKTEEQTERDADGNSLRAEADAPSEEEEADEAISLTSTAMDDQDADAEEEYIPGQDVQVDHSQILDILVTWLSDSSGE